MKLSHNQLIVIAGVAAGLLLLGRKQDQQKRKKPAVSGRGTGSAGRTSPMSAW
jgi:hypothetical protein